MTGASPRKPADNLRRNGRSAARSRVPPDSRRAGPDRIADQGQPPARRAQPDPPSRQPRAIPHRTHGEAARSRVPPDSRRAGAGRIADQGHPRATRRSPIRHRASRAPFRAGPTVKRPGHGFPRTVGARARAASRIKGTPARRAAVRSAIAPAARHSAPDQKALSGLKRPPSALIAIGPRDGGRCGADPVHRPRLDRHDGASFAAGRGTGTRPGSRGTAPTFAANTARRSGSGRAGSPPSPLPTEQAVARARPCDFEA